jgi:hypothetical protein
MTPNNNSSNDVTYESDRSTQTSRYGGGGGGDNNFQSDRNTTYNSHRPSQEYITQNNDENMRRSNSQNNTTRNSSNRLLTLRNKGRINIVGTRRFVIRCSIHREHNNKYVLFEKNTFNGKKRANNDKQEISSHRILEWESFL